MPYLSSSLHQHSRRNRRLCRELDSDKTVVALRIGYYMPLNLQEFVGPAGIWGDVNAILQENLQAMKARSHDGPFRGVASRLC